MKPRLLDLYCKAGGAAVGYHRAGFDVVGVDIEPQKNYPFKFILSDAINYLDRADLSEFSAIHASPPCQAYSSLRSLQEVGKHPKLVEETRERLRSSGIPYVIENVVGAPLIDPLVLCGASFNLGAVDRTGQYRVLARHRLFESNVAMSARPCEHRQGKLVIGVYGHGGGRQMTRGYKATRPEAAEALGIDWMTMRELSQSIPPAYTEYVGHFLMAAMNEGARR